MTFGNSVALLWLGSALLFSAPAQAQTGTPLPPPWQSADVGTVGTAGSAYLGAGGDVFVAGAGSDIWGTVDSFHYLYQPFRDGSMSVRVSSETNTNPFAKTGLMIRQSLDPASPDVIVDVKPDGGVEFMMRDTPGGETRFVGGGSIPVTQLDDGRVAFAGYLNLFRVGETVVAGYTVDLGNGGAAGYTVGTVQFPAGPALGGVAVTSHNPAQLNLAQMPANMLSVSAVPPPWRSADVGDVGVPGFATYQYAGDTFFVSGAGSDIWGTADSFHAVSQWLNTDSTLTAQVLSMDDTNVFAKAGIALGELASAGGPRVVLDVKPDGGIEFMARDRSGAAMSFLAGTTAGFPAWLRLQRTGDRIDGLVSADGQTWTTVGSMTLAWPPTIQGGLVVTSHDPSVLNNAQFDNVSTTSSPAPNTNLLVNPGFEQSTASDLGPGWVADPYRQVLAQTGTAAPNTGAKYGSCDSPAALDCGLYQDFITPESGYYNLTAYVAADKTGVLLGVNVNSASDCACSSGTQSVPIPTGGYAQYRIGLLLHIGDAIRIWLYSPESPGRAFIDDVSLTIDRGPH